VVNNTPENPCVPLIRGFESYDHADMFTVRSIDRSVLDDGDAGHQMCVPSATITRIRFDSIS